MSQQVSIIERIAAAFRPLIAVALAITAGNGLAAVRGKPTVVPADERLVNLAAEHFRGDISPAEKSLLRAAANGKVVDCQEEPLENRLIRADRFVWLCTDPKASALVTERGICICGAIIENAVDLEWALIGFPLEASRCVFKKPIFLKNSSLIGLSLTGTSIQDLNADGISVRKDVALGNGFKSHGEVRFARANIDGDFNCDGGHFTSRKGFAPDAFDLPPPDAPAIDAASANIRGSVFLGEGFKAWGRVDLAAATIGGDLNCSNGTFSNNGGLALTAYAAKIGRSVSLNKNFTAQGMVELGLAEIGKGLDCSAGQFGNSGGCALSAESMSVQGSVLLNNGFVAKGGVNFQHVMVGIGLYCDSGQFTSRETFTFDIESTRVGRGGVLLDNGLTAVAYAKGDRDSHRNDAQPTNVKGDAPALDARSAKIQGSIIFSKDFEAFGRVDLTALTIGGDLDCHSGHFSNSGGLALTAYSARIGGSVCLDQGFMAQGKVELRLAEIGKGLDCSGGSFTNSEEPALDAESMTIRDSVLLHNGFVAKGEVNLQHATVGIGLYCEGGRFDNHDGSALNAESARIGSGGVFLSDGFVADGEVRFAGAKIDGDMSCRGGDFRSSKTFALDANFVSIGGNALLNEKFQAHGGANLSHAKIDGDLNCEGGQFFGDDADSPAINADSVEIGGKASLCDGFAAEGRVTFKGGHIGHDLELRKIAQKDKTKLDLQFAKVRVLFNEKDSWPLPGNLQLQGFVYDVIHRSAMPNAQTQLQWIQTQNGAFMSQPYEQLAATLRGMGLQDQALQVMIEENNQAGREAIADDTGWKGLWDRCWYGFFGKLIGYGYQPWNALYMSFFFVVTGTIIFGAGYDNQIVMPTDDKAWVADGGTQKLNETYPKFNALIYSLESFVPLVKLAMEDHWIPNANRGAKLFRVWRFALTTGSLVRCYLWIHILAGWILTTLWVGAFTGLLKT